MRRAEALKGRRSGCSLFSSPATHMRPPQLNFSSLSMEEKLTLVSGVILVLLSLLAVLCFASVSIISVVTRRVSHYWNLCFVLCSFALGSWMISYAASLRLAGGMMVFRSNLLLLWVLILTVLVSAIVRFSGTQRYIAVLFVILSLVAYNIVVVPGLLTAFWLIRGKFPGR